MLRRQIQIKFCFDKFRVWRKNAKCLDKSTGDIDIWIGEPKYICRYFIMQPKILKDMNRGGWIGAPVGAENRGAVHSIVAQWTAVLWFLHFHFIKMHTTYIFCCSLFCCSILDFSAAVHWPLARAMREWIRTDFESDSESDSVWIRSKSVNSPCILHKAEGKLLREDDLRDHRSAFCDQ